MAKNLRNKLPESDTLVIQDINQDATASFAKEASGKVEIAQSVREVAEKSVSHYCPSYSLKISMMNHIFSQIVLSMI